MSSDSVGKTIGMALAVTVISSILVSSAVVTLKPLQEKNSSLEKKRNILLAIGIEAKKTDIEKEFARINAVTVDLTTGSPTDFILPEQYDLKKMIKSSKTSRSLSRDEDIAGIKVMPKYQVVYLLKENDRIKYLILPIYGKGLWSTVYGFLALESDLNTVKGITFYEHGETPGLGGEIENPQWKSLWPGKKIYGDENEVKIEVIKGTVTERTENKEFKVDGLAGATLTSRGVSRFIQFWTSDKGFGKYINNIREAQK